MKQDKLKFKADLISKYENQSIDYLTTTITLTKIVRSLHKPSTIFVNSLMVMLLIFLYKIYSGSIDYPLVSGLLLLISHFILFETVLMNLIFKDSNETINSLNFEIEILNDILINKKTS